MYFLLETMAKAEQLMISWKEHQKLQSLNSKLQDVFAAQTEELRKTQKELEAYKSNDDHQVNKLKTKVRRQTRKLNEIRESLLKSHTKASVLSMALKESVAENKKAKSEMKEQINDQANQLEESTKTIAEQSKQIEEYTKKIAEQAKKIEECTNEIYTQTKQYEILKKHSDETIKLVLEIEREHSKVKQKYDALVDSPIGKCIVCLDHQACYAFYPCGHLSVCHKCAQDINRRGISKCISCRKKYQKIIRIFVQTNNLLDL